MTSSFPAARRWLAAVGCGAVAAVAASAADPLAPKKLPEPVSMPAVGSTAPGMAAVGPSAPAPLSAAPSSCSECGGGCAAGFCESKHGKHKEEHKAIRADKKSCAHTPAPAVPPIGTWTREAFATQKMNALGEYFVVFREEWLGNSAELNASGLRHLDGVVKRLGGNSHSVKVEPTGVPALDEQRRAAVAQALTKAGVSPDAAINRVVLGGTRAEGLRGDEITATYSRSPHSGNSSGSGGGYSGGFGGFGGFGGGFR